MEQFKISDIQELFERDLDQFHALTKSDVARLLGETPPPLEALEDSKRHAHSLKGLAATVHAWALSCWAADVERLLKYAESMLNTDRSQADLVFNFIQDHFEDWYVMNQYSVLDLLPQAWEHYRTLRALMEERWKDRLPEINPDALREMGEFILAPAHPKPLDLAPPPLRRLENPASRDAADATNLPYEPFSRTASDAVQSQANVSESKKSDKTKGLFPARPKPLVLVPPRLRRLEMLVDEAEHPAKPKPLELVPPQLRKKENSSADSRRPAKPRLVDLVPPKLKKEPEEILSGQPEEVSSLPVQEPVVAAQPKELTAPPAVSQPEPAVPPSRIVRVAPPSLKRRSKEKASEEIPAPIAAAPADLSAPAVEPDFIEMLGQEVAGYLEELSTNLLKLAGDLGEQSHWENTRRIFHTIKGTAATFHLDAVSVPAKAAEARCIVAVEESGSRTAEAYEICLDRAQSVAASLNLIFDDQPLRDALVEAVAKAAAAPEASVTQAAVDPEMAGFFIRDANDQVEAIEQSLLRWEKNENPAEQVAAAQRGFHTLKGAANSIGLTAVAENVHLAEAFLEIVAGSEGKSSPALFVFFFAAVDQLRDYLRRLSGNTAAAWLHDWKQLLQALEQPAAVSETKPQESQQGAALVKPQAAKFDATDDESQTLRIEASKLYQLVNLIGEMVIDRKRLENKISQLSELRLALDERNASLKAVVQNFQQQFEFNFLAGNDKDNQKVNRGIRPPGLPGAKDNSPLDEFSELEFDRYDQFNVLARSLVEISHDVEQLNAEVDSCLHEFDAQNTRFQQTSRQLQYNVTNLSLVPVNSVYPRLKRVFRDALQVEQKNAELILDGGEAMLDKVVMDKIYAPLMHLLRNAVAHGVEDAATREKLQKPVRGQVKLSTAQVSNQIVIEISDDGAGLQPEAVRQRAIERGWLAADAPALTPDQVIHFIFQPGFSTAAKVTSVSGRGIGLDVVRKEIEALNGSVELRYEANRGASWTLRLPLTLSISDAILSECGGITFALPISFVESGLILDIATARAEDGREMYQVGESSLPVVRLADVLRLPRGAQATNGVIVAVGDRRMIFVVDRVIGRQEIVVKQLDSIMERHPLLNGATLNAEGAVIPILNLPALLEFSEQMGGQAFVPQAPAKPANKPGQLSALIVDDSLSVRKVQERYLTELGCKVVAATDGLHALEKLRENHFDIVFTDLEMPRVNGYELITEIKGNAAWASLPVVVISSRGADKYITKAMNLGASTFLSKPFNQGQLEQLLKFHAGWDAKKRTHIAAAELAH